VDSKKPDDWMSACRHMVLEREKAETVIGLALRECVAEDTVKHISVMDSQYLATWRDIPRNRLLCFIIEKLR
jgi:hypothetical protein